MKVQSPPRFNNRVRLGLQLFGAVRATRQPHARPVGFLLQSVAEQRPDCGALVVGLINGHGTRGDAMNQMHHLQHDLRQAAVALLVEADASALALALEEDPDGYWIAVGPKAHIPFLFGYPKPGNSAKAAELERESSRLARRAPHRLQ